MTTQYRAFFDKDYQLVCVYPVEAPIIPSIHMKNQVVYWHDFTETDMPTAQRKAISIGAYHRQRLLQRSLAESEQRQAMPESSEPVQTHQQLPENLIERE